MHGDDRTAVAHDRRVLPLRRRTESPRALPGRACALARSDYESNAVRLDRNEVGALVVAAGLGTAAEHGLISRADHPRAAHSQRQHAVAGIFG